MITIQKATVDKYFLQDMLRKGVYSIIFEKVDGSTRTMKCTLMAEFLPVGDNTYLVDGEIVEKPKKKENPDVVSVWDLEKEAWRSMRLDKIQLVKELVDGE